MILRRIYLHPFAGASDRELRFAPGLNVVLGPNEAGKSTLRRAIRQALFVSTQLTKREADREVVPYLPLTGGDTLRVSLDLAEGEALWSLTKQWAAGRSTAELRLPEGGVLSDPARIQDTLAERLGLTQGTWEHVLMAAQGQVDASLDRLSAGDLKELSALLRRAAFETDGVSIEVLAEKIEERHAAIFGRWDRAMKRPADNRGLEQRWVRGAGTLTNAWYERESARLALEQAERYYRRLDAIQADLEKLGDAKSALEEWIARHEPAYRDAEQRQRLEAELGAAEAKGKEVRQVSQQWPVADNRKREVAALLEGLVKKVALLETELARAKAWESVGKTRRLIEEVERFDAALAEAKKEREQGPKVEAQVLAELEQIDRERERLRIRIEAAALRVRIAARAPLQLVTQSGLQEAESREIPAGESLHLDAAGRVHLREASGAWEIEVSPGEIDVAAEAERHRQLGEELANRLSQLGLADLAAAKAAHAEDREKGQRLRLLERQRAELLGTRRLEDLKQEVAEQGGATPPARSLVEVAAEHARAESEMAALQREGADLDRRLAAWTAEYGSQDDLLDRLADLRSEHRLWKEKIAALEPLPEGWGEVQPFLRAYRERREELDRQRDQVNQLLLEKAQLAGDEPEEEPAAAAERLQLAEAAFARALREGEAIERIRQDCAALRAELDGDTLGPWQEHLTAVIAPLTEQRYRSLLPEEAKAERSDGCSVPFALLSAGTRASLGLAVRLSMARWFLEGRDGFLLLDDPFVDLDPERQRAAAEMLRRFAEEKQVIVFTCHPAHADRLGGTRLEL